MRRTSLASLSLFSLCVLPACHAPESEQAEQLVVEDAWIQLFDGESLAGWTPKIRGHEAGVDPLATFRVENGLLQVRYDNYTGNFDGRFGHLFHEQEFSHYLLRVEYRFVGEQMAGGPGWAWRNSGLMLHGQSPESMTINQEFPVSIEMQLLGGDGTNNRTNANLCTPGTNVVYGEDLDLRHCINSTSATCHGDEWYTVTVEVRGGEVIRHWLGEDKVMEYYQPQLDERDGEATPLIPESGDLVLDSGTISVQSESHPMDYRKIELKVLDS